MENSNLDYENKYSVIEYVQKTLIPQIDEDLKDWQGDKYDAVFEIINGLSDVIYNYQASKISEAFGLSPFDKSEFTGERYNSYGEMAFDAIYTEYYSNK